MRTIVSALLGLLALVAAAGGLACAWVDQNLVEESGFLAITAPLGQDTDFQAALSASVVEDFSANSGLPGPINALVAPVVGDATAAVTASAAYADAWTEVLRRSHAVTLAHAADPSAPASPLLTLDLAPVADLVAGRVGGRLGFDIPAPEDTTIAIGSIERDGLVGAGMDAVQSWPRYLAGAGVLGLMALVIARRRGTTLALLGFGMVVIGVVGGLAVAWIPAAAARVPGTGAVADVFLGGVADRVGIDVAVDSVPVAVAGLIAVVLGVVGELAVGRRA
ncbi:hypothetical protein C4K88_03360 [Arthrobacter pityocampae]|uniref:DUF4436 domain-containing protein n=1 Tax=Arthrobacter pityocampae TaxID=547334 RepID=A0A2S5J2D3_9MICC|nr:hypothetical protein [Arthrobacter pityocampae]PPB50910.1 hypothetical protein C4K88_03360 [Arthrobacter pityocampae]